MQHVTHTENLINEILHKNGAQLQCLEIGRGGIAQAEFEPRQPLRAVILRTFVHPLFVNHSGLDEGDHRAEIDEGFVVGHLDLNKLSASSDERIETGAHDAFDIGVDPRFIEVIERDADAKAF